MSRFGRRWRLGALCGLVALVTAAVGAGVGQSASGGAAAGGTLVAGTTDTVTNLDPAGNYDYGSFTLDYNIYEHLYDARNGAKLEPSLATRCAPVGTVKTWRCTLRRGVTFHDGSGVRLGGREVLVRPRDQDQRPVRASRRCSRT